MGRRRHPSVIDAAQRGNTSVYFTAARGENGPGRVSASRARSLRSPATWPLSASSLTVRLPAGPRRPRRPWGGILSGTNDLSAVLARTATDLSVYTYGATSLRRARAGSWQELEVRAWLLGVTGARASWTSAPGPGERARARGQEREARPADQGRALVAGGSRDASSLAHGAQPAGSCKWRGRRARAGRGGGRRGSGPRQAEKTATGRGPCSSSRSSPCPARSSDRRRPGVRPSTSASDLRSPRLWSPLSSPGAAAARRGPGPHAPCATCEGGVSAP